METIYATLITLIFAAWVWELKGQVTELRHSTGFSEETDGLQPRAHMEHAHATAHEHARVHHSTASAPRGVARENGVPTWVIE